MQTQRKATFPPAPEVPDSNACAALSAHSGLPGAWAHRAAWTILDTDFQQAHRFIATWRAWRADPVRPVMLHYVGHISPDGLALLRRELAATESDADDLYLSLLHELQDRDAGIHRILLDRGQVSLTLCIGDSHTFLGDHKLFANTVWFSAGAHLWSKWTAKALSRLCARGATLEAQLPPDAPAEWLLEAGFVRCSPVSATGTVNATFDPPWPLGNKEPPVAAESPAKALSCCVVGAGISGASVAYALARRGWQVTVLEAAPHAAAGASGLPVGLVVPHVSADDSPRSRLSRVGAKLMLQHCRNLLQGGEEWALSGVLEHRFSEGPDRLHHAAAWVKPAALVKAWLQHPNITVHYAKSVARLQRIGDLWSLRGQDGSPLAEAKVVVLATAFATRALLEADSMQVHRAPSLHLTLGDLQAVHGTASTGPMPEHTESPAWSHPHNGHGCFIPSVPGPAGPFWLAGSSFEPDSTPTPESLAQHRLAPLAEQHRANLERLQTLLPEAAEATAPLFQGGQVNGWSGTRCVTHDRLPLAGPVDTNALNGLWMHVGMGARGLTFSALGAEMIAARICHEPWPVESALAKSMDSQRLRKRRAVREVESDST